MLHRFKELIHSEEWPKQFTYPFYYIPHRLTLLASDEVKAFIEGRDDWRSELEKGKMFGVLVVRDQNDELGFLAAFSGILAGSNKHDYFVPPVFDLLNPGGYFKEEEKNISEINKTILGFQQSEEFMQLKEAFTKLESEKTLDLNTFKSRMKASKKEREQKRSSELSSEEEAELIKESQFQKAELKRKEKYWQEQITEIRIRLSQYEDKIQQWKKERKERSATLQQWLFDQFSVLNAKGESKSLREIFTHTVQKTPPAGAGECAGPKLLQYAYANDLVPIAMAEFWWGASPKTEVREHGHFYPACKGKCEPILGHMLQGLNVEPNPLATDCSKLLSMEILYDDPWLCVVCKPAGLLSVPGKSGHDNVYDRITKLYPDATGPLIVHRLDMATSGLLVIAKTKEVHQNLQAQFKNRSVKKRYIALLDGIVNKTMGEINLPIAPDFYDRPRQIVDHENGKPATTYYEVLSTGLASTRIAFYPLTGRTHQLRLHAAAVEGLNTPIRGDELYGKKSDRLYLHAEYLSFTHPVTNKVVSFEQKAAF
ncbi:MAG: RluA family pseudouridine synthase [Bacteroidales bacterium]